MKTKEIYDMFETVGSCTFATIENNYPETRIAHFRAHDDEGLYFMTMTPKPFYKQLKSTGKVSACGLSVNPKITTAENGDPVFEAGYFIRISGDVKEFSMKEIAEKNNPIFDYCIKDHQKYPSMVIFCLYNAYGEVFDYDFEKEFRDHKLERVRFSFGEAEPKKGNVAIDADTCIGCGKCLQTCSFSAIQKNDNAFSIDSTRCDECGSCYLDCPAKAIRIR